MIRDLSRALEKLFASEYHICVEHYVAPEIVRMQVEATRKLTTAQRIERMLELHRFIEQSQLTNIRKLHPDADEREIRMRLASRWVKNRSLLKGAFGWDVAVEGY